MRNAAMILALSLSLAAQAQLSVQKGWLRATVSQIPEPDRTVLLRMLDECRKPADQLARTLALGDEKQARQLVAPAAMKSWTDVAAQTAAAGLRRGAATLAYRNQALQTDDDEAVSSQVWYALVPKSGKQANSFVSVVVSRVGEQAGPITKIEFVEYEKDVPSWLLSVDAPMAPPHP